MPKHEAVVGTARGHLSSDDLIVDRALEAEDRDTLDHLPVAERVAELVATSATPMNVALFGASQSALGGRF